jgi:hypothetical protein
LFCDQVAYQGVSFSKRITVFQQKGKFGLAISTAHTILGIYKDQYDWVGG